VKIIVPEYGRESLGALRRVKGVELAVCVDERAAMSNIWDAEGSIGYVSPELVRAGHKLKWIQTESAGVDAVLPFVPPSITLTCAKGAYAPQMAEHHLAMMLALARRLGTHRRNGFFRVLEGAVLYTVGEGATGAALQKKAKALGMRLTKKLSEADYVAICCPLTEKTRGMFDAKKLASMKRGAVLTNAARGQIVVTPALVEAVKSGHLAGAGLDVTDPEPLSADHPLWQMENVILTPHIAGYAPNNEEQVFRIILENVKRFVAKRPLINVVDRKKGY
jgi:phosphoglycerate dehydrogenase-like enzyme